MKTRSKRPIKILAFMLAYLMAISNFPVIARAEGKNLTSLQPAATVISSVDAVQKQFTDGEEMFADRVGRHFFSASTAPAYLNGANYLFGKLKGGTGNLTVIKSGWLYYLTPTTTDSCQVDELTEQGFEQLDTIPANTFSTTIGEDVAVMGKSVNPGEVYTGGQWTIPVATLADIAELPLVYPNTAGTLETMTAGNRIFTSRSYAFNNLPTYFEGKTYLYGGLSAVNATVCVDLYAYVITPVIGEGSNTQEQALLDDGWTKVAEFFAGSMSGDLRETLAVMEKKFNAWETISYGKWGILVVSEEKIDVSTDTDFGKDTTTLQALSTVMPTEGNPGTMTAGAKLFTDSDYVVGANLPEWLKNKEFLATNYAAGIPEVTVTEPGYAYIITPISTAANSQQEALTSAGWTLVTTLPVGKLNSSIEDRLVVMGKAVTDGETISLGAWGVLVAQIDQAYKDIYMNPENLALKSPAVILNPAQQLDAHPEYAEYLDGNRTWQGVPSLAKDEESGRLWYTWYSGGAGEDEYNWSVLYTSDDDGLTWSGPKVVVDPETPVRSFDPNLWIDDAGRMWFIWSQSYYKCDGRCGVWAMYTDNPGDENPTWSKPMRWCDGIVMCDPIILTKDTGDLKAGDWVLPAAIWNMGGFYPTEEMADYGYPNCYVSKDNGMTWSYQGSVKRISGSRNCDENMIIQQADGSLRMLIRTSLGMEESYSTDGGKTWTTGADAGISTCVSRFWIGWLDDNTQLVVCNDPPTGNKRTHLTAKLSYDGGKTWTDKLIIDERRNVSYPDVHIDEGGNIYISYDYDRTGAMEIYLAKITKADIQAGKLVTDGSFLNQVVNCNMSRDLAVEIMPNKTIYRVGEAFDPTGLELALFGGNGAYQNVSQGYRIDGFSSASVGKITVTATYEELVTTFSLAIVDDSIAMADDHGNVYTEFTNAFASAADGAKLTLLKDVCGDVTISKNICIDLNGNSIDGTITVNRGYTLYGMDSMTDDYTVMDADGYGKIKVDGKVQALTTDGDYLMVTEGEYVSFHRVNLQINYMTLRAKDTGVYFKSAFAGDEKVAERVKSFGIVMSVVGEPTEEDLKDDTGYSTFTGFEAGMNFNDATSTLLKGVLKRSNAKLVNKRNANLPVYGRAYVQLEDGTYMLGRTVVRTFREQVEGADAIWDTLSEQQKKDALAMYKDFEEVMTTWEIPNIKAAVAE